MEELLSQLVTQLVTAAREQQAVASSTVDSGMQLLAYPLEQGLLLALGFAPELAHRVEIKLLLQKRGDNLARFGTWLPTLLNDGGVYVVTRVSDVKDEAPVLPDDVLMAAEELLT